MDINIEIDQYIEDSVSKWDHWAGIVNLETWEQHGKTKEDAVNLSGWYEGRYDMAIAIRNKLSDNK